MQQYVLLFFITAILTKVYDTTQSQRLSACELLPELSLEDSKKKKNLKSPSLGLHKTAWSIFSLRLWPLIYLAEYSALAPHWATQCPCSVHTEPVAEKLWTSAVVSLSRENCAVRQERRGNELCTGSVWKLYDRFLKY